MNADQHAVASPFNSRSTATEVLSGVDLSGQTALITGASSGIGVDTAQALAAAGAALILPVRSVEKGEAVAAGIRAAVPGASVRVASMDLGDYASIQRFAAGLADEGKALNLLINNAGIMACPLGRNAQGHESQIATNHFGHFLLTALLTPLLRAAGSARVVELTSIAHRISPVHLGDLHFERRDYDKWSAYGQSKTANSLFAVELDRRLRPAGISAFAVHPGGIMTGLQKDISREEMDAMGWYDKEGNINPLFKSTAQGASTSVWAATSPLLAGKGGLYLEDCNVSNLAEKTKPGFAGVHAHSIDPEVAKALWTATEKALEPWLAKAS
jgi:NAD(P)-dependent dehydrogenase (short-subunit alcohol dehydrogenase family)